MLQRIMQQVVYFGKSSRARNGIATNVLSRLGNLGLTFAIVNRSDLTGIGKYALAFAVYVFVTSVGKAGVTEAGARRAWSRCEQPPAARTAMSTMPRVELVPLSSIYRNQSR